MLKKKKKASAGSDMFVSSDEGEKDATLSQPVQASVPELVPPSTTPSLPPRREEGPYISALSGHAGEPRLSPGGRRLSGVAEDEQPKSLEEISWSPKRQDEARLSQASQDSTKSKPKPGATARVTTTANVASTKSSAGKPLVAESKKPALHFPEPYKLQDDWASATSTNVSPTPAPRHQTHGQQQQVAHSLAEEETRVPRSALERFKADRVASEKQKESPPPLVSKKPPQENAVASSSRVQLPPSRRSDPVPRTESFMDEPTDLIPQSISSPVRPLPAAESSPPKVSSTPGQSIHTSKTVRISPDSHSDERGRRQSRVANTGSRTSGVVPFDFSTYRSGSRASLRPGQSRLRQSLSITDLTEDTKVNSTDRLSSPGLSNQSHRHP